MLCIDCPALTLTCNTRTNTPEARSAVVGFPLVLVFALPVGADLVARSAEHVGHGLRGDDDGLDERGRHLAQHAPNRARDPFLVMLRRGNMSQCLGRPRQSLQDRPCSC